MRKFVLAAMVAAFFAASAAPADAWAAHKVGKAVKVTAKAGAKSVVWVVKGVGKVVR